MEINFKVLQEIFVNCTGNYSINGLSAFLLSDEEEPFKLYKLNMSTHEDLRAIIYMNLKNAMDAQLFEYQNNTSPDGNESVSCLKKVEVPNFLDIEQLIIEDNSTGLTKKVFEESSSSMKGYVIDVIVTDNNTAKEFHVQIFSTLSKSNFYKPKKSLYSFGNEDGDLLQKVEVSHLELNEKCCAICIDDEIFVTHSFFFERLFKYEEHINMHSEAILGSISGSGLIDNFLVLESHCSRNKNFKRKLFTISSASKFDNVTFDTFQKVKEAIDEGLFFSLDSQKKTIRIDEENSHKSVDQIIRIINDEAAETLVSETRIFANQRINIG
ncbi:Kiwa anti-phage protein KwaB-like domain-containing protein [Bacillus sp. RHFS10]|uniref:Kiwa anti-phage protein KwaB-like domain-containing protein n=1 Tax=Bacillus sp. RHFS10 TaxID=2804501 RepID=UPI001927F4C5|nr:Kiwa anti-phage protein KwaB-like domain-containing protein [Bacillus sp. RHFS10]MBL3647442.1 DUF4868 domain-containing protein [Bacillus sp. RHFS10]